MAVDISCFHYLASKSLADDSGTEADFRNAVSRAYYYMYHAGSSLTNGKVGKVDSFGKPFKGGVHKKLSSYLADNAAQDFGLDEKNTRRVGILLRQMHALRVTADYYLEHSVDRTTAEMVLLRAVEIGKTVKEILETRR